MNKYDVFSEAYYVMIATCLRGQESVEELNTRTGQRIRVLPGGASFRVDLAPGALPVIGIRKPFPHIAAAETAWCLLGHNHVDWLRRHTPVWDRFADDQPCTVCEGRGSHDNGSIESRCENCGGSGQVFWLQQAYGNRWRNTFGVDQLAVGLERLMADPSDRRVWISSWDPGEDIKESKQKTLKAKNTM